MSTLAGTNNHFNSPYGIAVDVEGNAVPNSSAIEGGSQLGATGSAAAGNGGGGLATIDEGGPGTGDAAAASKKKKKGAKKK